MDEQIIDTFLIFSSLEMSCGEERGIRSTTHLLESQIGRFVLAGGASVNVTNAGKG